MYLFRSRPTHEWCVCVSVYSCGGGEMGTQYGPVDIFYCYLLTTVCAVAACVRVVIIQRYARVIH